MNYHRLFRLIFSVLISPLLFVAGAIAQAIREVTPLFDAKTTLALDRLLAPVAVIPEMRSRFDAFVKRALAHDLYSSGHFDPGRAAA